MGDDVAEAYGRRNAVPGELLVRVRPTRVVALGGIADQGNRGQASRNLRGLPIDE
jgi:hypothetical protein